MSKVYPYTDEACIEWDLDCEGVLCGYNTLKLCWTDVTLAGWAERRRVHKRKREKLRDLYVLGLKGLTYTELTEAEEISWRFVPFGWYPVANERLAKIKIITLNMRRQSYSVIETFNRFMNKCLSKNKETL